MAGMNKNQRITRSRSGRDEHPSDSGSDRSLSGRYSHNTSNVSGSPMSGSETSFSDRSPFNSASPKSNRSGSSDSFTSSPRGTPVRSRGGMYPNLREAVNSDGDESSHQKIYPDLDKSPTISPSHEKGAYENAPYENIRSRGRVQMETDSFDRFKHDKPSKVRKGSDANVKKDNTMCITLAVIASLIMLCVLTIWANNPSSNPMTEPTVERLSEYKQFIEEIRGLEPSFPAQEKRFWRTIISSSKHILDEANSTYPSVILLASQVKTSRLSGCIAEKIASSFLRIRGIEIEANSIPSTDIDSLKKFEASHQKLKLDEDIRASLETPHGKAYIIKNLQALSPKAAILLHGLCDGDHAPYKDVMILMTLEVREDLSSITANKVEDYLEQLWTTPEMDYDKVSALMSRVSNNIVILQHEDSEVVEKMCP